jgi:hypothetical protein
LPEYGMLHKREELCGCIVEVVLTIRRPVLIVALTRFQDWRVNGSVTHHSHGGVMSEATIFPEVVELEPALNFAREHFGGAALGHKKRNACLLRVAEKICRHPGGTLPHKLANPSDYKAMDVLMNRPEVTHASVLAPHLQRTQERIAAATGVVLLLHDTTTLDYSGLSIPELGPVGNGGGRGYLCHNSLAVDPERREVLGLASQILHRRVAVGKKEGVKAKRERRSRESRLWSQAVQTLKTPAGVVVVDVADRGADIYEFLAAEKQLERQCIVRASHNRSRRRERKPRRCSTACWGRNAT